MSQSEPAQRVEVTLMKIGDTGHYQIMITCDSHRVLLPWEYDDQQIAEDDASALLNLLAQKGFAEIPLEPAFDFEKAVVVQPTEEEEVPEPFE
jgi:hypothetical protein